MEHAFSKKNGVQFVRNGPHLPVRLLQAHEDGHVVFFCGAGISSPVFPDFACLVKRLYNDLKEELTSSQKKEIKKEIDVGRHDIAVGRLEASYNGAHTVVRQTLASFLEVPTKSSQSTDHESLLELSKNRNDGCTRLVTTNFDRLFEKTITKKRLRVKRFPGSVIINFDWLLKKPVTCEPLKVDCFDAPLLPVPNKQWDGLVYLHGLLPENPTQSKLDHLVVSSGDFGRAYLTERWAARFVSELFRKYIVCFVGYSLNDPVLRYMTDAIAADRQRGESVRDIFAFQDYSKDKEEGQTGEWKGKKVTLIPYLEDNQHAHLREILKDWCETYRDGVQGKCRIVAKCATAPPSGSTEEDGFVSQVLWALRDLSGLPAKRFAELDPVRSLDWLKLLSGELYNHTRLGSSGIATKADSNGDGASSLLLSPSNWDQVMRRLAPWLTHHLDDPDLLLWMANCSGSLRRNLVVLIESRLDELSKLKPDVNKTELEHILSNTPSAPNAIPSPLMRALWRLLLTGRVSSDPSGAHYFALGLWKGRFTRYGLTATLRLQLHECLSLRISLHKPIKSRAEAGNNSEPEHVEKPIEWEVVPFANNVFHDLVELIKDEHWKAESPKLLTEFSSLLRDALDLMHELDSANDRSDPSHVLRPSISEHTQNRKRYDWTALITLTRDAWLSTAKPKHSPERARNVAEAWSQESYPLFRRLAFFAAAQGKTIPRHQGLAWLLADKHRWLWSPETKRETMRLLFALAPRLTKTQMLKLEKAILNGPPRTISESHIDHEQQSDNGDWDIWLRLAKIDQAHATLGKDGGGKPTRATLGKGDWLSKDGRKKLTELSKKHSDWKLAEDERDEFPVWISVSGMEFVPTPRPLQELIKWLKKHPTSYWRTNGRLTNDDWQERCRNNFPTAACALCALAKMGNWPAGRWETALQTWSEEKLTKRSWRYMAPVLANAPDEQLQPFAPGLSQWLSAISKTFAGQEEIFLKLCERVLKLKHKDETDSNNDFIMRAVNHPVGCATKALLNWWSRGAPKDEQGLPRRLKTTFTRLCNGSLDKFRHGRVLLAVNLISLFRVDQDWTTKYLLPSFNWQTSETEACAAWQGFLWFPRHYDPLMEVLKTDFLETASHYKALTNNGGRHDIYGERYASLLTYAALNRGDTFGTKELATATRALPPDGLSYAAQELARVTEGTTADERRDNYWKNRVAPYLHEIWPKKQERASPAVTNNLGRVCIAAQEVFPEAFDLLQPWLQLSTDPSGYHDHYHYVLLQKLHKTTICTQFPEPALNFLDLVIPKRTCWIPEELGDCLKAIQDHPSRNWKMDTPSTIQTDGMRTPAGGLNSGFSVRLRIVMTP